MQPCGRRSTLKGPDIVTALLPWSISVLRGTSSSFISMCCLLQVSPTYRIIPQPVARRGLSPAAVSESPLTKVHPLQARSSVLPIHRGLEVSGHGDLKPNPPFVFRQGAAALSVVAGLVHHPSLHVTPAYWAPEAKGELRSVFLFLPH